jgi:hypothetical protein
LTFLPPIILLLPASVIQFSGRILSPSTTPPSGMSIQPLLLFDNKVRWQCDLLIGLLRIWPFWTYLKLLGIVNQGLWTSSRSQRSLNQVARKARRINRIKGRGKMPSVHYETVAAFLEKNIELLSSASGEVKPENIPLLNINKALLALSDALQDEFVAINTRLNYVAHQLER